MIHPMKRALIITLGCKVNQYESAAFHTGLVEAGYSVTRSATALDLVIINTCAVTAKAGSQSRQAVRKALRDNPAARIVITGCYAELAAKELAGLNELHDRDFLIVGNSKKDLLVAAATAPVPVEPNILLGSIMEPGEICRLPVRHFGDRTRAYLRVQDGCESFCTYCIVPFTRGPSRSLPVDEVLTQASNFAEAGFKEIVLTGIHLGNYGRDLGNGSDLFSLLDALSLANPQVRLRISSLEPTEIDARLLNLIANRANIMNHLHIPLQSGCDEILAKMNRGYTTAEFRHIVELCRMTLVDCAIGIDILAGFPGETRDHHASSREFLDALPCTYLHVFPYSRREGTIAADMADQVAKQEKDGRVRELRQLGESKRDAFYRSQLGRTLSVLVEGRRDRQGFLHGFSENYVPVRFAGEDTLKNTVVAVTLQTVDGPMVTGEVNRDEN